MTCLLFGHHLNQRLSVANWILENNFRWNCYQQAIILILKNISKLRLPHVSHFVQGSKFVLTLLHGPECWYQAVFTKPETHDDVIKWKHFPRYWPFVRGIHRSPVNSPHKGQWRGALMFSVIYVWINDWVNNREAGDLRRYRAHCDVIVMNSDTVSITVIPLTLLVLKSEYTKSLTWQLMTWHLASPSYRHPWHRKYTLIRPSFLSGRRLTTVISECKQISCFLN